MENLKMKILLFKSVRKKVVHKFGERKIYKKSSKKELYQNFSNL